MNRKAIKANQSAIRKWKRILEGTGVDRQCENCPLCKEYPDCDGCPVLEKTGLDACMGSPWTKWYDHGLGHEWHEEHEWRYEKEQKVRCQKCWILAFHVLRFHMELDQELREEMH